MSTSTISIFTTPYQDLCVLPVCLQAAEWSQAERQKAAERALERARDMMARDLAAEPGVRAFVRAKLAAHTTLTTGKSAPPHREALRM